MKNLLTTLFIFSLLISVTDAQDTFSIVAIDTLTGEVGSAGASCVDMDNFPGYADDFLGELSPGVGAINTQAYYDPTNQANARERMNMGETPSQIIQWLIDNDVTGQPQIRQYGIVAFVEGSPESAAHTGSATNNYKNHITGPNYSIQGNILLGQEILDSMEARFLDAGGDLACKLMAALQGAKTVGADTRCTANGTSSLFAFVKVAQPADTFGSPSLVVSVRTKNGQGIEPIDTLQTKFDLVHDCSTVGMIERDDFASRYRLYPNPADGRLRIEEIRPGNNPCRMRIINAEGKTMAEGFFRKEIEIDLSGYRAGLFFISISDGKKVYNSKFIRQ